MADREDILAAVRTAILLARTSRMSLSVTVLDESVLQAGPGDSIPHETLDNLLNSDQNKTLHPTTNAPLGRLCARSEHHFSIFSHNGGDYASNPLGGFTPAEFIQFEVTMLDLFYVAIVIAFFVLLWGFTRASERL